MFRSVITALMLTSAIAHAFVGCDAGLHCVFCHDDDVNAADVSEPVTRQQEERGQRRCCSHAHSRRNPVDAPQEQSDPQRDNDSHGHPGDHCTFVVSLPGVDAGSRWQERLDRDHVAQVMQPTHATTGFSVSARSTASSTCRTDTPILHALGVLLL